MSDDIEFDLAALNAFLDAGAKAAQRAVELTATEVWGNVGREAPVDHGRLAGSFQLEQRGDLEWAVFSNVEYALAVHEGTSPYEIFPVNAQALRFVINGQVIFAQKVSHPGIPANPYGDRAVEAAQSRVDEFIEIALQEAGVFT